VRAAGLRVPDDVSVVGFDDVEVSGYVGLTTVRQPLFESGSLAAMLLLGLVGDDEIPDPLVRRLDLEFVERSTTAPPKKSARATGGAARMERTVREDR
jgi:DNA-binding LacI/PurR family transcriptional regulator